MNHLKDEKSPYLRQHREQPVDWYPWGSKAFNRAQRENKPVFLSIGYSTCHWCHVMAHEAFEDEAVAALLNESFISIKVDREERPDIDSLYMRVCTGLTGSGGWPLTILMTPEQQPFFAATYLPSSALQSLLEQVRQAWRESPDRLRGAGQQLTEWLQKNETERPKAQAPEEAPGDKELFEQAAEYFRTVYDPVYGGFGAAPKFPSAHNLSFLLRKAQNEGDADSSAMVHHTLRQMAQGGLHDHLGGGFARYSTDRKWLLPHFEKTLYDNALLAMACSEAGYAGIAAQTLDYVLRELTHPEGGFYCGQDADSDGEEGKFYRFTREEILQVLGRERGQAFLQSYAVSPEGVLYQTGTEITHPPELAEERQALMEYRRERCVLGLDDKILTSWNGLMIAALAQTGHRDANPGYIRAAERAQSFIQVYLTRTSGRLWHRFCRGEAACAGQLSDYAFYAYGLLQLYHAVHKAEYLLLAVQMADWMEKLFADPSGGYYEIAKDSEALLVRLKETGDGALPSGNSGAAMVLVDLAQLTGERRWREAADRQTSFLRREAEAGAAGYCFFLQALQLQAYRNKELLCAAADDDFRLPRLSEDVCAVVKTPSNAQTLGEAAPFTRSYPLPEQGVQYHLCESGSCRLPVEELPEACIARPAPAHTK